MESTVPIAIAVAAAFLLALGAIADDRRARLRRRVAFEPESEPPLLHSINDDRCIGCEACVDACPTEVLELVDHKARVIRFSDCVQCEQCANACPTTAMVMYRQGTTPQTLSVPELDEHFQTGIPGQYLIGEVAGKPLVKNAANLGRAVIEHITRDLAAKPAASAGVLDVAIVGSGPGGLSAGLTCLHNRLSCVVIEKEHALASTVARYPKGKLFMAEPVDSGNVSYLPAFDASKEELIGVWQKVVAGAKLAVKLGEAVDTVVRGDDGVFTLKTTVATYRARAVVLATGLRGKPRLLAVPGANLEKVKSRLDDPHEFAGQHVLVVGGGDSAVEAAMSLADVGATVTLSYRGDGFKRCKQGNQKRLAEMTAENQITEWLGSNVCEFTGDAVTIKLADGTVTTISNQQAFVLIGADTPVAWLSTNNVRFVEREHLYALGSTEDTVRKLAPNATECPKDPNAAVAIVLGKQSRASHGRLKSVVSHIQDEFRDALTNITGVFRISDLEAKSGTRTGIKRHTGSVVTPLPKRPAAKRPATAPVIPAANLTRRRPSTPPRMFPIVRPTENPFEPENTVRVPVYDRQKPNANVPPPPQTTTEMPSLAARLAARDFGQFLAKRPSNPFDSDPTTLETARHDTNVAAVPFAPDHNTTVETALQRDPALEHLIAGESDTSVDHPKMPSRVDAVRKASPPPIPPAARRSPRAESSARATTFPPEPAVYSVSYDAATREVHPVDEPSPGAYHLIRPSRMPRGTPPPPVPRRKGS